MKRPSFYYDVHGIVRIRSARRLPELGYFLTQAIAPEAIDIDIRIVPKPTAHARVDAVRYREVLGRFGFSIVINRGERTNVFASPLIGASPHVLYTNVVEPLLRWTLVRKGYALMHGACLAFGERAIFITARTDTGKTTTILRTLRYAPGQCTFLSDDMTIFCANGQVLSFPKPLTISQHTVQAIGGAPLSIRERLFLKVQSRLHSKGGRQAGMWLNDIAMPAATLSAIVQKLIPPPKFMVDRLVPGTRYTRRAQLSRILVIERGKDEEGALTPDETLNLLAANSEDAYGFPPYPKIARELTHWQSEDLQAKERSLVATAVGGVPATYLRSSRYAWHEHLPQLANSLANVRAETATDLPLPEPSSLRQVPSGILGDAAGGD